MQQYRYEIFTSVIEKQIKSGILKYGDRLPSVREMKEKYGLSRTSVQSGYEYLIMKGWVHSSPRSGYFVAYRNDRMLPSDQRTAIVKDPVFTENMILTSARNKPSAFSSFNNTAPGDPLIPQKLILKTMQQVIRKKGASLLRYYPVAGSEELRHLIAERMTGYGTPMSRDELIITDGALQSLFIALHAVVKEGDCIAVESPCVFSVLEVITSLKCKVIEIPVHFSRGFDLESFRKLCEVHYIRCLVVTANFHNPTGTLMSDEVKEALADLAGDLRIPVIENDIYGDIFFSDTRPRCIKSFDKKGFVMTVSSFSKTLSPGIRLGWLNTGRFYAKVEMSRFSLGRTVAPIYQELMIELLKKNSYDRHLRSFRKNIHQQSVLIINALRSAFPQSSCFHQPEGGYSIWAEMPENLDMDRFYNYCEEHRILFTPGATFSLTRNYQKCFRIVFAEYMTPESINLIEKAGRKAVELLTEHFNRKQI
ncbi:PLP-dependent aminotransferase family protein [Chryseobacterium sp. MYb264]|uniref:aminotransferase-like domain-containing protein n=1 Tax=Chryseobacterium sp. MYb264 TaxID=2745153 RepID=UPI002E12B1EC|nr:PLP-dependent aminotransferase family protein [Chryseobacterium sp. MYb264]